MKITIITKECKTKDKNATTKANLCFRLRDKDVDLKVRSDIKVMLDYWDNDALSYRRTKKLPSDEQKKVKFLVQTITTALSEQYNSATADVAWMKNVIDECVNPTSKSTETLTTVVSRMEQYIAEHPMSPKSALVYKPTVKTNPSLTMEQIGKAIGIGRTSVYKIVKSHKDIGVLEHKGRQSDGKWVVKNN